MDTFKDRLAFLWKDEARQAKIAADIDMTITDFQGRVRQRVDDIARQQDDPHKELQKHSKGLPKERENSLNTEKKDLKR